MNENLIMECNTFIWQKFIVLYCHSPYCDLTGYLWLSNSEGVMG